MGLGSFAASHNDDDGQSECIDRLKANFGRACDFKDIDLKESIEVKLDDSVHCAYSKNVSVERKVDRITILYENDGQALVKVFFVSLGDAIDGKKVLGKPKEHEIFFVTRKSLPS